MDKCFNCDEAFDRPGRTIMLNDEGACQECGRPLIKVDDNKVFCSVCRWFNCEEVSYVRGVCNAPANMFQICNPNTWYSRGKRVVKWDKWPEELNKNNDCQWFAKKT